MCYNENETDIAKSVKAEFERTNERNPEPTESSAIATKCEVDTSWEVSQLAETLKRRKWTKNELLVFLRERYQELGRVPGVKDVAEWSKKKLCPSYPTCMKVLEVSSKTEWDTMLLER